MAPQIDAYRTTLLPQLEEHLPLQCVMGSPDSPMTCPCCNRTKDEGRLNEPACPARRHNALVDEAIDAAEHYMKSDDTRSESSYDSDEGYDEEDERDTLPGVLLAGVKYRPRRVLAEGWVHKKGTGFDLFKSRAWKARYCRLVLATIGDYDTEVPLLLVYWFSHSEYPSTVITLDSTVVVPTDRQDTKQKHCFSIIHAKGDAQHETTRTFALAQKGRDAWVLAISQALHNYEKGIAQQKAAAAAVAARTNHFVPKTSLPAMGIWSSDACVEVASPLNTFSSSSRSNLPLSPRAPPLPRPDVLIGESFLEE